MNFHVIGIDDNSQLSLSGELLELIGRSKIFSGGERHRKIVADILPPHHTWIDIKPPMRELFEEYLRYDEVVVFASGDPLFYGFGSTLQRYLPQAQMELYPTFNSLQILAHRAQIPYHDMKVVSLTGRSWEAFDSSLIMGEKLMGVLTDTREHTPEKIAQRMLRYGYDNYSLTVGEQLGNPKSERVARYTVDQVAQGEFTHPCNMMLERTAVRPRPFGIADSEFVTLEGRSRMITKMPIRITLLSMMGLRECETLWDVGFCTGSVSIETKLQFPHLKVVSFERREECGEIIERNITRFGAMGIDYHIGDFMEQPLDGLPSPDVIFIGGHGGNLLEILRRCSERVKPGGKILFNSVSPQSEALFLDSAKECGLTLESQTTIKIEEFNTIKIIKIVK